ncbi:MAG TPA: glycosyltransferase [Pseudomonadota bacterium]|nr:glycosyltransferase [Pseudomonadota bacterium]
MPSPLRIVNYAVNGSGAGHLTRLCAINRWLRRYTQVLDLRAEIYFLTTSEADSLLFSERFASFKLPSKTIIGDTGIDKTTYLALAKQWVWHSLGLLRPDLFLVDTFPRGSFGELLSALDLCQHKAFIHRSVKEEFLSRPDFAAMLPLYDLILVPEHEEESQGTLKGIRRGQLQYTGPVMIREKVECWPRDKVRAHFGVAEHDLLVYVSAGGGGDRTASLHLQKVCEALRLTPNLHLVIGAGPLYRGPSLHGPRMTFLTQSGVAELLSGMDLAVCSAGYNSFHELLYAGIPTVFLPQDKIADEQDKRADLAEERGAAQHLRIPIDSPGFLYKLSAAVDSYLDPSVRRQASLAAQSLVPHNHARDAAQKLLALLVPGPKVMAAAEAVDDLLIEQLAESGMSIEQVCEIAHVLRSTHGETSELIPCEEALSLLRLSHQYALPQPALVRMVRQLAGRIGTGGLDEKSVAMGELLQSLAGFSDWPGAQSLLKQLPQERSLPTADAVAELRRLLGTLRSRQLDLYEGVKALSVAQSDDQSGGSLSDLVTSAIRKLS